MDEDFILFPLVIGNEWNYFDSVSEGNEKILLKKIYIPVDIIKEKSQPKNCQRKLDK